MYKPGDVVRLKSGGPLMTVDRVRGDIIFAQWITSGSKAGRGGAVPQPLQPPAKPGKLKVLPAVSFTTGHDTRG
ncbi:DUF2158 domain-containing protein [Cronobacter turicensis]|nr:DUF2158 domain-containing protein [Cronobacter turicensis]